MSRPLPARDLNVLDLQPAAEDILGEVLAGLKRTPKSLPSKLFYDARGSALFEQICAQPEYYLTRTELGILQTRLHDIASAIGEHVLVLEFGSGSGIKTRLLLGALDSVSGYIPIDISKAALTASAETLRLAFTDLPILPVCADFTTAFDLPKPQRAVRRRLMFFPGSTLGNFVPAAALALLRRMRSLVGVGGQLLLGVDMKKDPARLEAAYNDAAGITETFTLNLLTRLNRELGADFDLAQFQHRARYHALAGRIETHLVSRCAQTVEIRGHRFAFRQDEAMLVEYSTKYAQTDVERLATQSGFRVTEVFSDDAGDFSLQLLEAV